MLAIDELLDAAAGDVEPDFDLGDIRDRADRRVRRRWMGGATGVCVLAVLAAAGSLLAGQRAAVDRTNTFETLDVATAPSRGAPASAPRHMGPDTGSLARFHLPLIFDESPLPLAAWPPPLREHLTGTTELFALGEASDAYFATLEDASGVMCFYVVHPDAGPGGYAEDCEPATELLPHGYAWAHLCCPVAGLVTRDVQRVGYDTPDGGDLIWVDTPRGVFAFTGDAYLDPTKGFGLERLRFELSDGQIVGSGFSDSDGTAASDETRPDGAATPVAFAVINGDAPTNRFGHRFEDGGFASCALYDDHATADATLIRDVQSASVSRDQLPTLLSTHPEHGHAIFAWQNFDLGATEVVIPPVSRVVDGRLSLFTSYDTELGRIEMWVECGFDYLDARTVARARVSAAPSTPDGVAVEDVRLVIDAIDVDVSIVGGVGVNDLRDSGAGWYPDTSRPGEAGNSAIAGHRTTFGAAFNRIDELVPGDAIAVTEGEHTTWYRVVVDHVDEDGPVHTVVDADAIHILGDFGDDRLTLTSEHPKYQSDQRIVVVAEMVSDPIR